MKNIKLLILINVFVINGTAQAFDAGAFRGLEKGIISLIGAGTGAGALAIIGIQKGMAWGKEYEKSLGIIAAPLGGLLGGVTGIAAGGIIGASITVAGIDLVKAIKKKIKEVKTKLEEMKQQYYKTF